MRKKKCTAIHQISRDLRHFCRTQHLSIHDRTLSHPKHEILTRSVYTGALVHSLQGSQHCWVIQYGKAKGVTPFMRPSSERMETPRLCGTACHSFHTCEALMLNPAWLHVPTSGDDSPANWTIRAGPAEIGQGKAATRRFSRVGRTLVRKSVLQVATCVFPPRVTTCLHQKLEHTTSCHMTSCHISCE